MVLKLGVARGLKKSNVIFCDYNKYFSTLQVNATNKYFLIFKDITDYSVLKKNYVKKNSQLEDDITVQRLARYRYSSHLHVKITTAEMDTFVIRKSKNVEKIVDSLLESSEPCTSTKHKSKTPSDQSRKRQKYQEEFIKYGFTCSIVNNIDFPQCVICSEVLAHENLKPGKMQRQLELKHPSFIENPIDYFRRKEKELQGQKHIIAQQAKITSNALEASYEVAYLIAQIKKQLTIGETMIKPAAVAMCRVMHGEKIANELMTVPLSNDTVACRVHDIAKDIKSQLIDRINGKKICTANRRIY